MSGVYFARAWRRLATARWLAATEPFGCRLLQLQQETCHPGGSGDLLTAGSGPSPG
ncbi:hypothetical protein [Thermogemmatispora sp.]|uniref:hypothetical protein n=1 Tax=Thermogemmatispora sp. TaxID=1968838 RepID=UPI0035E4575D